MEVVAQRGVLVELDLRATEQRAQKGDGLTHYAERFAHLQILRDLPLAALGDAEADLTPVGKFRDGQDGVRYVDGVAEVRDQDGGTDLQGRAGGDGGGDAQHVAVAERVAQPDLLETPFRAEFGQLHQFPCGVVGSCLQNELEPELPENIAIPPPFGLMPNWGMYPDSAATRKATASSGAGMTVLNHALGIC